MKKQKNQKLIATAAVCAAFAVLVPTLQTLSQRAQAVESQSIEHIEIVKLDSRSFTPEAPEMVETEVHAPQFYADPDARARDIELIGRTIWGEAEGVESAAERAAVAWCILNRADAWDKTIEEVVTAPHQFYGYRTDGTCPQEHLDLAEDVLSRWESEKLGTCASGRTLPAGYLYFTGDGSRNHFTKEWGSSETWTWALPNPYK